MKIRYSFIRLVIGVVCILSSAQASLADESSGSIQLNAAISMLMPASGVQLDGEYVGFEVDLINALAKGYDPEIEVNFVDGPNWKRTLDSLKYGDLDLVTTASYRKSRLSFMDYIGGAGVEAAFLLTRVDQDLGPIETLDDLMLGDGFIVLDPNLAWYPEFDERLKNDEQYARHFTRLEAGQVSEIADMDRLREDPEYRKKLVSLYPGIYEDGSIAFGPNAERISLGKMGGFLMTINRASRAIETQRRRIENGGVGTELKATRVQAFGVASTYLVASRNAPLPLRNHLKSRYSELQKSGEFSELWKKWYGSLEEPEGSIPAEE